MSFKPKDLIIQALQDQTSPNEETGMKENAWCKFINKY